MLYEVITIGFMSFGGMLTGGDEKPKAEHKTEMTKQENNTTPSDEVENSKDKKKEKVLANNIKVNE